MKKTFTKMIAVCFLLTGATLISNAQKVMGPEFSTDITTVDFGEVDNTKDTGFRILKFLALARLSHLRSFITLYFNAIDGAHYLFLTQ